MFSNIKQMLFDCKPNQTIWTATLSSLSACCVSVQMAKRTLENLFRLKTFAYNRRSAAYVHRILMFHFSGIFLVFFLPKFFFGRGEPAKPRKVQTNLKANHNVVVVYPHTHTHTYALGFTNVTK